MQVVITADLEAPMSMPLDMLIDSCDWLPDDIAGSLTASDYCEIRRPNGKPAKVWRGEVWEAAMDSRFHYVSAVDGARRFLVAGPYQTAEAAEARLRAARDIAEDRSARAVFMAWGTASSEQPEETLLGRV